MVLSVCEIFVECYWMIILLSKCSKGVRPSKELVMIIFTIFVMNETVLRKQRSNASCSNLSVFFWFVFAIFLEVQSN